MNKVDRKREFHILSFSQRKFRTAWWMATRQRIKKNKKQLPTKNYFWWVCFQFLISAYSEKQGQKCPLFPTVMFFSSGHYLDQILKTKKLCFFVFSFKTYFSLNFSGYNLFSSIFLARKKVIQVIFICLFKAKNSKLSKVVITKIPFQSCLNNHFS